jgi:hypothetical protein
MLPCPEGLDGPFIVIVVRKRDVDGVDIGIIDEIYRVQYTKLSSL